MNEEQSPQQKSVQTTPEEQQKQNSEQQPQVVQSVTQSKETSTIKSVERITAWVMVLSAIFFALISLLAVWGVFGDSAGDIVWKSLTSLGIIAFTALIINVGARMIEGKKK